MNRLNFMLSVIEYDKRFITVGPDNGQYVKLHKTL